MADDPGPGFRAELLAALNILDPQIEGLDTLLQAGLSAEVTAILSDTTAARRRRKDLISAVIMALNDVLEHYAALVADGYPELPGLTVEEALANELQKEKDAIEAAITIFEARLRAEKIELSLGGATEKPREN